MLFSISFNVSFCSSFIYFFSVVISVERYSFLSFGISISCERVAFLSFIRETSPTVAPSFSFLAISPNKEVFFFFSLLGVFIYLYRTQKYITDKEYLKEMIEHHSMALLTSNKILEKTDNYNIAKLAKNILQTQEDEINVKKDLLKIIYWQKN